MRKDVKYLATVAAGVAIFTRTAICAVRAHYGKKFSTYVENEHSKFETKLENYYRENYPKWEKEFLEL